MCIVPYFISASIIVSAKGPRQSSSAAFCTEGAGASPRHARLLRGFVIGSMCFGALGVFCVAVYLGCMWCLLCVICVAVYLGCMWCLLCVFVQLYILVACGACSVLFM